MCFSAVSLVSLMSAFAEKMHHIQICVFSFQNFTQFSLVKKVSKKKKINRLNPICPLTDNGKVNWSGKSYQKLTTKNLKTELNNYLKSLKVNQTLAEIRKEFRCVRILSPDLCSSNNRKPQC